MTIPNIIPVSDLRQDSAAVLKRLQDEEGPLVITQRGRAVGIIQSLAAFRKAEKEREILRLLAMGEREIAAGEGYSLASIMKEADVLLRDGTA